MSLPIFLCSVRYGASQYTLVVSSQTPSLLGGVGGESAHFGLTPSKRCLPTPLLGREGISAVEMIGVLDISDCPNYSRNE